MRYYSVPDLQFTDINGVVRTIKDMREPPAYTIRGVRGRLQDEPMDYTAQLSDVFGPGQEGNAYLLWEANAAAIVDVLFDLRQISRLKVPIPQ